MIGDFYIDTAASAIYGPKIAGGLIGVAATVDGPSGGNAWEVDLVNNSGQHVSFTEFTVCTA